MLRQKRIELDWTQEYVGVHLGITPEAIRMIESGQRYPSFRVLVNLEDLFGMDYRDLFNLPRRQLREQQTEPDASQT